MGYRLEVSKIEYKACGGKLYGYCEEEKELESYKYLLKKNYIDGDEYWSYGCNPKIILTSTEFKEFMQLYNEDMKKAKETKQNIIDNDNIKELLKTDDDKLLEWL